MSDAVASGASTEEGETHPPTMSESMKERSIGVLTLAVASAIAEKTSGAPLPIASSVTPATSGERRMNSERKWSCGMRKRSAVLPSAERSMISHGMRNVSAKGDSCTVQRQKIR